MDHHDTTTSQLLPPATENSQSTEPSNGLPLSASTRAPVRQSLVETLFAHETITDGKQTEHSPRPSGGLGEPSMSGHNHTAEFEMDEIDDIKSHQTSSATALQVPSLVPNFVPDASDNYMNSLPPPPPFDLEIDDLTIGVPPSSSSQLPPVLKKLFKGGNSAPAEEEKVIVRNVSAACTSGEMLAIIGGSGSGKTTVLNAIVGRLANLPVQNGSVSFFPSHRHRITRSERNSLTSRKMKDKIGFVKQQDTLLEHLTVRETLMYAAALRLPTEISSPTRDLIVTQTIEELGLRDVADTIVGGALRKGISGGERRRLSIGCALVSMPSVLVADESTTGLDAFTAYTLLLTLSQLARRSNRTVILTLHQPRSSTFPLFDRLLLLSRGRVVFSGPRAQCLPWFASLDLVPGSGMNPLDWLIDVSTVDTRADKEEESRDRVKRLVNAWEQGGRKFVKDPVDAEDEEEGNDPLRGGLEEEDDEDRLTVGHQLPHSRVQSGVPLVRGNTSVIEVMSILSQTNWDMKRIGMFKQTLVLLSRAWKDVSRNYGLMLAFGCQSVLLGGILGFVFFRLPETPSGIQSLKTLCLQHLPYYTYLTLIYSVYRYCTSTLILFDREREDSLYAVGPWLISEFATNLPVLSISATLFAILVYFLAGMRTDQLSSGVGIFIAENILVQLIVVAFALLASSLSRIYAAASTIVNTLQIFMIMTAGLLLLHPPQYINWMRFISPYYYGFRSVAISQFKNRTFACTGVTGIALNQCDGNRVLAGVLISPNLHPGYYLAALCGMVVVSFGLAGIVLAFYHPGGVTHAKQLASSGAGKESMVAGDLEIVRQQITVDVRSVSLKWTRRQAEKNILHSINARFPSGEVTAILGPSGAGKSSLLQLIAGRHMNAGPFARFAVDGEILFNGQPRTKGFRTLVSFVEQEDDHHMPALTVRETLRYAAILRLPRAMSRKRKIARAEEVLQMLGLSDCADNVVGGELLKGISGGEKRRLSLAVEMISDPAVLVVDEPTSGLDAMTAHNVMLALKAIAASGRTVIASIHQPRSDIWHAGIDNVVLLAKGGRTAMSCPKSEVSQLCATLGYPIPDLVNPADWILDLVSVDNRGNREETTRRRVSTIIDSWALQERKLARESKDAKVIPPVGLDATIEIDREAPMYIALPVVISRMFKNLWRQQPVFWMRLYQTPLLGCIFLFIYQRLRYGPTGGQDRLGFVLEIVSPMAFVGVLNSVAIFPADRDIFFHEVRSSAGYSVATFVVAFTLVEIPLELLGVIISAVVVNIGAGMQTSPRIFFEFCFAQWALLLTGESIGMMFGSFTRSMGFNVSLISTFITILVQLCGVVSVSIPDWLSALAWSTTIKFSTRIVMINECVGLRLHCTDAEVASGECLVQTGEELLALVGWRDWNTKKYCGILAALTVGYRILAWAVIRAKVSTF